MDFWILKPAVAQLDHVEFFATRSDKKTRPVSQTEKKINRGVNNKKPPTGQKGELSRP